MSNEEKMYDTEIPPTTDNSLDEISKADAKITNQVEEESTFHQELSERTSFKKRGNFLKDSKKKIDKPFVDPNESEMGHPVGCENESDNQKRRRINQKTIFEDEEATELFRGGSTSPTSPVTCDAYKHKIEILEQKYLQLEEAIKQRNTLKCLYYVHHSFQPGETLSDTCNNTTDTCINTADTCMDTTDTCMNTTDTCMNTTDTCMDTSDNTDDAIQLNIVNRRPTSKGEYEPHRILCLNKSGVVIARTSGDTVANKQTCLEILRFGVGSGQRTVKMSNQMNYNMAAIDVNGFVLARASCQKGIWQPSVIEYHPFEYIGLKSKSSWYKQLTNGEDISVIACGHNFVTAITSRRLLRIYSGSGIQTFLHLCLGEAVCMATQAQLLMIVTFEPRPKCHCDDSAMLHNNCNGHQTFYVTLVDAINGCIYIQSTLKASISWGPLTWICISDKLIPICGFKNGLFLGAFATWRYPDSHFNEMLQNSSDEVLTLKPLEEDTSTNCTVIEWTVVIDLDEVLENVKDTNYIPYTVNGGNLEVFSLRGGIQQLPVPAHPLDLPVVVSLPFRLPVATGFMCPKSVMKYRKWLQRLQIDPNLRDVGGVQPLEWEYIDSVRLLQIMFEKHLTFLKPLNKIIHTLTPEEPNNENESLSVAEGIGNKVMFKNLPLPDEPMDKMAEMIYRLKASTDAQLFKIHLQAVEDDKYELAVDCIRRMNLSRTIKHAHSNLESSGRKGLLKYVNQIIEIRIAEEQQLIAQGVNVDGNLRQISLTTAFQLEQALPLSVPAIIKRFSITDSDGQVALETPASKAADAAKSTIFDEVEKPSRMMPETQIEKPSRMMPETQIISSTEIGQHSASAVHMQQQRQPIIQAKASASHVKSNARSRMLNECCQ